MQRLTVLFADPVRWVLPPSSDLLAARKRGDVRSEDFLTDVKHNLPSAFRQQKETSVKFGSPFYWALVCMS